MECKWCMQLPVELPNEPLLEVESDLFQGEPSGSKSMMLESIEACMDRLADVVFDMEETLAQLRLDLSENTIKEMNK